MSCKDSKLGDVFRAQLKSKGPPLLLFLALGIAWEAMVVFRDIPKFLLPAPSVIIARMITDWHSLAVNAGITLLAASLGFVIGTTVAILLSISFLYSRSFERAVFPWAIVLKTIPILAIAPLLTIWLGFGIAPKIAIAAIACVFPTLVNMTRGLRSLDKSVLDFMAIIHAEPADLLRHARLFAALPYLFSAMKITVGMSVIGAIVAEFTGANQGIGTIIVNAGYRQDAVMLFSAIFVTSAATVIFFYAVVLLEKLALFWPGADIEN
ncbi:ABC transporter permease [Roseibium sp.]|uniref:ABC transporter permease n=1 Tax=Roseibium sp. TaxID=1936156 RepID=UPI003A97E646